MTGIIWCFQRIILFFGKNNSDFFVWEKPTPLYCQLVTAWVKICVLWPLQTYGSFISVRSLAQYFISAWSVWYCRFLDLNPSNQSKSDFSVSIYINSIIRSQEMWHILVLQHCCYITHMIRNVTSQQTSVTSCKVQTNW